MKVVKRKDITEITLLSVEEYRAAEDNIPPLNGWWWLRSPSLGEASVADVGPDGFGIIGHNVGNKYIGVRPAIRINPRSVDLQIGEKTQYDGHTFTCIAEDILLCDEIIREMPFRKDRQADNANNYEASDVKAFLDKWLNAEKKTVMEKLVTSYVKTVIEITEITLLSAEEYITARNNIPTVDDCWWLRSPGDHSHFVAFVAQSGGFRDRGLNACNNDVGVRPALRINPNSLNLQIRDKIRFGDFIWTYVAEGILLCDEIICKMSFRKDRQANDANKYEVSDVKAFLNTWLEDSKGA